MTRHLRSFLVAVAVAPALLAGASVAGAAPPASSPPVTLPGATSDGPTSQAPPTIPASTVPSTTTVPDTTTTTGPQTRLIVVPPPSSPTKVADSSSGSASTTTTRPAGPAAVAPKLSEGQVEQILRTMARSGASSTTALVEALRPLQGLGMTAQEALALGMGRFPLQGVVNWTDDWLDYRAGPPVHQHMGNDLFAAFDTPVRAPADGTVRFASEGLGGLAAYVTAADGTYYYMAHLKGFAPGLASGAMVKQGQIVGFNGDSGDASGGAPHVHFEIHPGGGPAVNPKLIVDAWVADALARVPDLIASLQPRSADGAVPQILVDTGLTRRFSMPDRPMGAHGAGRAAAPPAG